VAPPHLQRKLSDQERQVGSKADHLGPPQESRLRLRWLVQCDRTGWDNAYQKALRPRLPAMARWPMQALA
jgi:hypothetical protein